MTHPSHSASVASPVTRAILLDSRMTTEDRDAALRFALERIETLIGTEPVVREVPDMEHAAQLIKHLMTKSKVPVTFVLVTQTERDEWVPLIREYPRVCVVHPRPVGSGWTTTVQSDLTDLRGDLAPVRFPLMGAEQLYITLLHRQPTVVRFGAGGSGGQFGSMEIGRDVHGRLYDRFAILFDGEVVGYSGREGRALIPSASLRSLVTAWNSGQTEALERAYQLIRGRFSGGLDCTDALSLINAHNWKAVKTERTESVRETRTGTIVTDVTVTRSIPSGCFTEWTLPTRRTIQFRVGRLGNWIKFPTVSQAAWPVVQSVLLEYLRATASVVPLDDTDDTDDDESSDSPEPA